MQGANLAEVTRGGLVECIHQGFVVILDQAGKIIAQAGNPQFRTYIRSAAKPMQAVPVVESGAAAHFGFGKEELAFISSSHSGEDEHVGMGERILDKLGFSVAELQCGTHLPLHGKSARNLLAKGLAPSVLHNTCSGKHAGMLALAKYRGWDIKGYHLPDHPVQQAMLETIAAFTQLSTKEIPLGVDGCGVPVFAMTMERMAFAYAQLSRPTSLSEDRQEACRALSEAMTFYPSLVAGTGRLATDLMKACGPRFIAKDGAEGVFCIAIPEKGWGLAVKIMDGSGRGLGPVVISALTQLGVLKDEEKKDLAKHTVVKIKNYRDEEIGEIRPSFTLV
jgi:L-asparaginase II